MQSQFSLFSWEAAQLCPFEQNLRFFYGKQNPPSRGRFHLRPPSRFGKVVLLLSLPSLLAPFLPDTPDLTARWSFWPQSSPHTPPPAPFSASSVGTFPGLLHKTEMQIP